MAIGNPFTNGVWNFPMGGLRQIPSSATPFTNGIWTLHPVKLAQNSAIANPFASGILILPMVKFLAKVRIRQPFYGRYLEFADGAPGLCGTRPHKNTAKIAV
jgi:hypothetical protein